MSALFHTHIPGRWMLPLAVALLLSAHTGVCQVESAAPMKISSTKFNEGGVIPAEYTCEGANTSPDLQIANVPSAAKSLVLIVEDPDAARGTLTHWLLWGISPDVKEILANNPPQDAVQGVNFQGKNSYTGPCPPSGTHQYLFHLYALDIALKLPPKVDRLGVDKAMEGHVIAKAELIGLYSKSASAKY